MRDRRVVVVGAGVSGLVAAYWLHEWGLEVTIIESRDSVGGVIRSERHKGYLIEHGPNSTLEDSPKVGELLQSLGIADKKCEANAVSNRRYILKNGSLVPLPTSPPAFFRTKLFSARAKLRLFAEPFVKPAASEEDESVADFVDRRLGREFLDYAINPFIAGVYAGDPSKLSVRSAVPRIYALEKNHGSLIRGALKSRKRRRGGPMGGPTGKTFSFKDGMGTLPDALGKALGDRLILKSEVQTVAEIRTEAGPKFSVAFRSDGNEDAIDADAVVITSPAYKTSGIISGLDAEVAYRLKEIVYVPIAAVFMGFKGIEADHPMDGFGFLVPEVEKRNILGTIFSSTLFPERAENGSTALTAFVGGARQPELLEKDDEGMAEMVLDDLRSIIGLRSQPDVVRVIRWKYAIPQYALGYHTVQDAIGRFEKSHPGLFITGNFRGGISVSSCIVQSSEVARLVHDYFESKLSVVRGQQLAIKAEG
jgi:oxygen-dependent protoporphyrinogen oxidase